MKALFIITGFIILSCCSCVTTVQPLMGEKQMIADDRLVGNWDQNGTEVSIVNYENSNLKKKIRRNGNTIDLESVQIPATKNVYIVSYKKDRRTYYLFLALTRINNNLFCNLLPLGMEDPADNEAGMGTDNEFMAGYTIARVDIKNKSAVDFKFLDGELIRTQVLAGNMRIKHEYNPLFGTFLITAGSTELQQFVGKYGNDQRFFSPENSITLKRKG